MVLKNLVINFDLLIRPSTGLEEFLKKLDLRQRQVALTVRILDVNLSDGKTLDNSWAMRQNNNFIVNDNGKLLAAFGKNLPPDESGDFASSATAAIKANPGVDYLNDTFLNFLRAQIESKNTKILASPTLILNEFPGQLGGESVSFSDISNSLKSGTIGNTHFKSHPLPEHKYRKAKPKDTIQFQYK